MTISRRELLAKGAAAAAVVGAPKLLSATLPGCVFVHSKPGDQTDALVINCGSCADEGMAGHYPNCYFPQYLRLNTSLTNATINVHNIGNRALANFTITQAQWDNVNGYAQQLAAHMSVAQTAINEGLRTQQVGDMVWQAPTQQYLNLAANWATRYGFDPGTMEAIVNAAMPMGSTSTTPSLEQQVMALPNTQGLDHLISFALGITSVVGIQNSICGIAPENAQEWMQTGGDLTVAGVGMAGLAPLTGPAAPFVELAGDATVAYGGIMWVAGWLCSRGQ